MANKEDKFKPIFKKFKSKSAPLHDLLSGADKAFEAAKPRRLKMAESDPSVAGDLGVRDPREWEVWKFEEGPAEGLVLARKVLTPMGQQWWAVRCLRDYSRSPPNRTNLDGLNLFAGGQGRHWFQAAMADPGLVDRLRWATLGYHHNWDTKVYSEEDFTPFPEELAKLSKFLASTLDLSSERYFPSAAIVNFYPPSASLGPHTDHSEPNRKEPLLSLSLGRPAVFLVGGADRSVEPLPLVLRSGDVVAMSGPARECVHAVPRILPVGEASGEAGPDPMTPSLVRSEEDLGANFVADYLKGHRININARQVH